MVGLVRTSGRLIPLLLCFLWSPVATAQVLTLGQRIRVTTPEYQRERFVGELLRFDQDSLVLESDGERQALSRPVVTLVETFGGRHGHAGYGALIGGLLVGGSIGIAWIADPSGCDGYESICAVSVSAGALAGAGLGALIGTAIRHDDWIPLPAGSVGVNASSPGGWRLQYGPGVVLDRGLAIRPQFSVALARTLW